MYRRKRQRILISDRFEPRLCRQAQLANARVYVKDDLVKFVRQSYNPVQILHRARNNAQQWSTILDLHLKKNLHPTKPRSFWTRSIYRTTPRATFLKRMQTGTTKTTLRRSSRPASFDPCVCVEGELIFQHPDGWYLDSTGTKICDSVIVQQIPCQQDGTRWHRGEVQVADQSHGFLVREDSAQKFGSACSNPRTRL